VTDAPGRPQDQGRRHRRKGSPTAETATLLAQYQAAMRAELRSLLTDIRGKLPDPGLGLIETDPERPALSERARMWDLAIRVARELGTEVDQPDTGRPAETPPPPSGPRRRGRIDYGPDR
jgi:hypothetical protein